MAITEEQVRLIFGLKLRQIRNEKELSLFGLSKKSGLSKSYLNEIEKGKKYPKPDKIVTLATALDTPYDELVSMSLTGTMAPLSDIIKSSILKEVPLELFGIEESHLIDIIANAPKKVAAFIATLFEIARNYDVTRESFYLAALRSYQETYQNYFADLEKEVKQFVKKYHINTTTKLKSEELEEILTEEFGYTIDYEHLGESDFPEEIRSVLVPKEKRLLIAENVSERQRVFILAKELGYCHMQITQRPLTFTWIKFENFEDVLNNFKASYFAGAMIIPEDRLVAGLKEMFKQPQWNPDALTNLMFTFTNSAETFFQRLTNILPTHFGLNQLFFLRFGHSEGYGLRLTKELHLSRNHQPHAVQSQEHYCRRWVIADLLLNKGNYPEQKGIRVGVQRSYYPNSEEEYLILAAGSDDPFNKQSMRSVCVGIEMHEQQKKKIKFSTDESISTRQVGVTCERCAIEDCSLRVSEASIYMQHKRDKEIENRIYELIGRTKNTAL